MSEWNELNAVIEDEFDDTKDAESIKDYQERGELLTVRYAKPPNNPSATPVADPNPGT